MKYRSLAISALILGLSLWGHPSQAVNCPVLSNGDLFKVPKQSAVYMVNDRGERMYFPNSEVFFTWYSDFKSVKEISPLCVENYPSGGGINYRPGTRLVKTDYSNKIYAIAPGNVRQQLASAEVAAALYGPNWEKSVRVIHENFMLNLSTGEPLVSSTPHNGQLVRAMGSSTTYLVRRNALVPITNIPPSAQTEIREVKPEVFQSKPTEPTSPLTSDTIYYDAGQKTTRINWQVQMYQKIFDVLDFINGVGSITPPTVTTIAGQGDTLYVLYRADKTGHRDWNVKEGGSYEDLVRFLNAEGEYASRKPVAEAMFVDRDRLYVFYRGEDTKARWAYAPTNGINALTDFMNGTNGNTSPRLGSVNGKNEKNPVVYYRQDQLGPGKWGWKRVTNNDMTDLRNFLNGFGAYGQPVIDAQAIHNGEEFFVLYRR